MTSAPMPQPQKRASAAAKKLLASFLDGSDPIPDTVKIESNTVVMTDLIEPIEAFREQRNLIAYFGLLWPCARLVRYSSDQLIYYWVPIDLRNIEAGQALLPIKLTRDVASGSALKRATARARGFGLPVSDRSLDESETGRSPTPSATLGLMNA